MDVKQFVDITLDVMPKIIKKLVPAVEEIKNNQTDEQKADPMQAMGSIMGAMMKIFGEFEAEFKAAGTNMQEFSTWGNEHEEELKVYLETNADAKAQMDEFKNDMDKIM
jgi:hypothetical protein